jgi:hypothetical protein
MDETGLFWRQAPSSGLATERRAGIKKDKARITAMLCSNMTGSYRLPLWLIGKALKPRALRKVNLKALNTCWRGNKKAWVNTTVMIEWLQAFYSSIEPSRSVLLLMDNHSAHILGVEMAPPPANIRIQWLPPNSTSLYQPLDQGIIAALKLQYRRRWLQFMVEQYERNLNPLQTMTLYHAVRWLTRCWSEMKDSTIYRCFRKARILPSQEPISLPSEQLLDLTTLFSTVRDAGQIQDMMSLSQFLNPEDENIEDQHGTNEPDIDEIIARHIGQDEEEIGNAEDEMVETPIPSISEALQALEIIQRYQEHQETSTVNELLTLQRIERSIGLKMINSQQQDTLDGWISHNNG